MTDTRLLVGSLSVLAVAVSFGLTVLFFGFVVLLSAFLLLAGLVLFAVPTPRRSAVAVLAAGGVTLAGPLIYVCLAVLQSGS